MTCVGADIGTDGTADLSCLDRAVREVACAVPDVTGDGDGAGLGTDGLDLLTEVFMSSHSKTPGLSWYDAFLRPSCLGVSSRRGFGTRSRTLFGRAFFSIVSILNGQVGGKIDATGQKNQMETWPRHPSLKKQVRTWKAPTGYLPLEQDHMPT
jgi:hypothetical protein